jgi:(1->4)-alpha-D-glucan 1-alpha-D-glucosylmutase
MNANDPYRPRAVYRLQVAPGFDLRRAAEAGDYLAELGVSHAFTSPVLRAARGSTHGYNVVDPTRVSDDLGGPDALDTFTDALDRNALGWVTDIVPNHMGIADRANRWWWDVLTHGPGSEYAAFFDVDFDPPQPDLKNKVLLPVLGKPLEEALAAGELQLAREGPHVLLRYYDNAFPLEPTGEAELLDEAGGNAQGLEEINRNPQALREIIDRQHYVPAHWRRGSREINYRRFFTINTLVGLRVDREEVFERTHRLYFQWIARGRLHGLRVDHPDGLRDPAGYLRRLRERDERPWIVVEKILHPGETLPESFPVAGTTGYDFLNVAGGLFVDPSGEAAIDELYRDFTDERRSWAEVLRAGKLRVLNRSFGSETARLARLANRAGGEDWHLHTLHQAVVELAAGVEVYRTYVTSNDDQPSAADAKIIERALRSAREAAAGQTEMDIPASVWELLGDCLHRRNKHPAAGEFVERLEQLTAATAAKGVEDTAFYVYNRLVSLNEVGGDPGRFGTGVEDFHRFCEHLQEHRPTTQLATSTHDTKRGEDTRLRISLLSEVPGPWAEAVRRWADRNESRRRDGRVDRNSEYLFYQTLVGARPIDPERMVAYMLKAVRESKVHTSWRIRDEKYEQAVEGFVRETMGDEEFLADVEAFAQPLLAAWRAHSLSQTLLKLTAPGVAMIYQGSELWNLSLVDPDNRREVDYDLRRRLMKKVADAQPRDLPVDDRLGESKLYLTHRVLRLRRDRPEWFGPSGGYEPIRAVGRHAERIVAYRRGDAIVVAPRLRRGIAGRWDDTRIPLPDGDWTNLFGGGEWRGEARPGDLLAEFPVALLLPKGAER